MMNCDTDFVHCTQCGSYAIKDVYSDIAVLHQSACCKAPISKKRCKGRKHAPFTRTGVNDQVSHPTKLEQDVEEAKTARRRKRLGDDEPKKKPRAKRQSNADAGLAAPRTSHADCDHPATPAARRACRKARAAS